ncbi:nucleoside/nucleotide kinase family protein [Streptacidiphilus sp. P02-A3a]|nr:nucleoside/nucleotide kinase family protein [Streptacidiphilus sp. P02-A3a]
MVADAARLLDRPGRRLLGLCGPPAAGKSALARTLVDGINVRLGTDTAAYLPLDGFHLSNQQLERLGLGDRKGSPPSFDVYGYAALLRRVGAVPLPDHDVYAPDYDRTLHEPVAARHRIAPGVRLVVAEGNYLGLDAPGWREAAELLDELWYVDAPDELREQRLRERHLGNGSSAERARARVEGNDRPNGELVKSSRGRCTRVVGTG